MVLIVTGQTETSGIGDDAPIVRPFGAVSGAIQPVVIAPATFLVMLGVAEFAVIGGSAFIAQSLCNQTIGDGASDSLIAVSAVLAAILAMSLLHGRMLYSFRAILAVGSLLPAIMLALTAVGGVVGLALLAAHGGFPRDYSVAWVASAGLGIAATRGLAYLLARHLSGMGRLGHSICVVGRGVLGEACAAAASNDPTVAKMVLFSCDVREGSDVRLALHRALASARHYIERSTTDTVLIALPLTDGDAQLSAAIAAVRDYPVRVLFAPGSISLDARRYVESGYISGLCLLPVAAPPLLGWRWVAKDVLDRLLALLALAVFAVPMLAIAAAIKLSSPGPVLFRQQRLGYGGRMFTMLKFRTMHAHVVSTASPSPARDGALLLTERNDPRVFRFGDFLRRTSLDELPQLLNVIRGDMWVVGPRPHSPFATAATKFYDEAVTHYAARHRVKPGITGWAQVNGWRGPTKTIEQIRSRVEYDLQYIENWSLWLDLRILLMTVRHGFVHKNAF